MPEKSRTIEIVDVRNRREWREWMEIHHSTAPGVWLIIYKAKSETRGVSYEEAVEEALSFGWIDSKANSLDQNSFKLMFTPRKPGSIWAKSNKERIEKLVRQGRMTEAGLKAVEIAKADGSWYTSDSIEDLVIPSDLSEALISNPEAKKTFERYSNSIKKQVLWFVASAKQAATRQNRISRIIELMNRGGKVTELYWKKKE